MRLIILQVILILVNGDKTNIGKWFLMLGYIKITCKSLLKMPDFPPPEFLMQEV